MTLLRRDATRKSALRFLGGDAWRWRPVVIDRDELASDGRYREVAAPQA